MQGHTGLWGAQQNGVARVEGGEGAQFAQQGGGVALQVGGVPAIHFLTVDLGDDGQVINIRDRRALTHRAKTVPAFGFDRRAVEALFRQAYLVRQRVTGNVVGGLFRADVGSGLANNQRHRRAAHHLFAFGMRDGIAGADQGIARFDKPDGGFWRRVVRGLMKCVAPGVELAAVIECHRENSTFHSFLLGPGWRVLSSLIC